MPYKKHKQYRLPNYNYSEKGDYFITICTKNKIPYFGKIIEDQGVPIMDLSIIGIYLKESINAIPKKYNMATLGETIIMPNHVHLVITITDTTKKLQGIQSNIQHSLSPKKGLAPLTPGSISSIINHLKGDLKKWCKANNYLMFAWQARFHDHIIRNSKSYNRINNYIANNIFTWQDDENNQKSKNFRKTIRP